MSKAFHLVSAVLLACHGDLGPSSGRVDGVAIAMTEVTRAEQKEIDRIAWSCRPEAIAELVVIAGTGSGMRPLRCRAMKQFFRSPPIYDHDAIMNVYMASAIHRMASELGKPQPREALAAMLADREKWCEVARGPRGPLMWSPRDLALTLLSQFPDEAFRATFEQIAASGDDDASVFAQDALRMLGTLRSVERIHPNLDVFDETWAEATPEAFDRLYASLAAGPAITAADGYLLAERVMETGHWMDVLATPPSQGEADWDCMRDMRRALETGPLGEHLMMWAPRLGIASEGVLFVLGARAPQRLAAWAAANVHSPDPKIRSTAVKALELLSVGNHAQGSAAVSSPTP